MTKLLVAKSTFYHEGELIEPGEAIPVEDEDGFLETNLCEEPDPDVHSELKDGPADTTLWHHGGGWYTALDRQNAVLGKTQGEDGALDIAESSLHDTSD